MNQVIPSYNIQHMIVIASVNLMFVDLFNQLNQMGVKIPDDHFVNDVGTPNNENVRSSCQSVYREDHFTNVKNPTLCCLWVIHVEKGRVVVARGTVFPSNSQGVNMIHNIPMASHNVRVSIDDVVPEYQLTPLPVSCDEHDNIGNAAGSFVQWPKDLVTLGQDPISLEKKKSHKMTPKAKVHDSEKVESKGSVTPVKKNRPIIVDDISLSEHCAGLSFLLKKRPPNKKGDVFTYEENGEDLIHITPEDVDQFLKMRWLNTPIIEIFLKYVSTLCKQLKDDTFAFMLPSRLAMPHKCHQQRQDEAIEISVIFWDHWMLLLFCLHESAIYVFDPLKKDRTIRLKTPARMAFKLYVSQGGQRNNKKEFLWHHTEVKCPQQGDMDSGFFVMRYMYDIVMLSQKQPDMNWKVVRDLTKILFYSYYRTK
ncbi:uncharacterized protein LOC108217919 [Daucus carota subsp. sativus]|uniref:uncharacterized protein LOC108217919 n=1 Tax=Daucus carota subsp. sativus TaxID=79200 RepID=UPI003082A4B8